MLGQTQTPLRFENTIYIKFISKWCCGHKSSSWDRQTLMDIPENEEQESPSSQVQWKFGHDDVNDLSAIYLWIYGTVVKPPFNTSCGRGWVRAQRTCFGQVSNKMGFICFKSTICTDLLRRCGCCRVLCIIVSNCCLRSEVVAIVNKLKNM